MDTTYLGNGKFRVTTSAYEVIVQLSCEVDEVLRGDIHVRGGLTFDEVNEAAMKSIVRKLATLKG